VTSSPTTATDTSALLTPDETEVCDDGLDNDRNGFDTGCSWGGDVDESDADALLTFYGPVSGDRFVKDSDVLVGGADSGARFRCVNLLELRMFGGALPIVRAAEVRPATWEGARHCGGAVIFAAPLFALVEL
jgi:hypothetical protein